MPSFTINLSSSQLFSQTLCEETSKIKDQQELKTLSEKEDSVGERHNGDKIQTNMPDQVGGIYLFFAVFLFIYFMSFRQYFVAWSRTDRDGIYFFLYIYIFCDGVYLCICSFGISVTGGGWCEE